VTLIGVWVENNTARAGGGIFNKGTLSLDVGTVVTQNTTTVPKPLNAVTTSTRISATS
jgi:hypothetical protein